MTVYLNSFLTSFTQAGIQCLYRQAMAANSLGVNILHQGYYYSSYCASVVMGCYAGHLLFISTCTEEKKELQVKT